jgi:hypothetical protein
MRAGELMTLLTGEVEGDFYLGLGGVAVWRKAPVADGILCGGGEKSVAGFDLGGGDGAVCLDGDEEHDGSTDMHAASELWVDGGDALHDRSMESVGEGWGGAESEASEEKETVRDAVRDGQGNLLIQRFYRLGAEDL